MRKLKIAILTCGLSAVLCSSAFADWVLQESGKEWENQNYRYEQDGQYLANQWMEYEGEWYYLGADGFLLNNITQNIDGVDYTFDSSGRWAERSLLQVNGKQVTYSNMDLNYSIRFDKSNAMVPSGFFFDNINNSDMLFFHSGDEGYLVDVWNFPRSEFPDFPSGDINSDLSFYIRPYHNVFVDRYDTPVQIGDFKFERIYIANRSRYEQLDVYICTQESGSFMIVFDSIPGSLDDEKILKILGRISRFQ